MNSRFYFLDVGVCRYFMDIVGAAPMFGVYKEGEIDFLINSRLNYKNYGVEVKAGRSEAKTARMLLEDRKVEAIYLLKGDTYGGITEDKKIVTVPIYLVSRVNFEG